MSAQSLKPGIYFNLSSEIYHRDAALSRSDMVNLLDTPYSYWVNSSMNPERKRKGTNDGMEYGEAFDYLLFAPEKFEKLYQVVPIDAWDMAKKKIKHEDYYAMVECIKVLKAGENSGLFLSGGLPHVTIVFEYAGLRFRCQMDYMTPVLIVDFKTSYTLEDYILKRKFYDLGYDIQMRLYKWARIRFREQFLAGEAHVYGNVNDKFFKQFMASQMDEFMFIIQRNSEPYPYIPLMPEDDTEESGSDRIEQAVRIYKENFERYGTNPWPVCNGKVKHFSMFYGFRNEGN